MYPPARERTARLFTKLPDHLHFKGEPNHWVRVTRPGKRLHSFLEGPSFDRDGYLYCVDVPHGRVFRISPAGEWTVVADYDGEPSGLKIHKDGRIFIADHMLGIMEMDPVNGKIRPVCTRPNLECFRGVNDLFFAADGDLYFTDPGRTTLSDPTGRLYCLRTDGKLDLLLNNVPHPNGLVSNLEESSINLAVTRANAIWRVVMKPDRFPTPTGLFIQMSGGLGPDGLALDEDGSLAIAHAQSGSVWLFSKQGEPLQRIRSCAGLSITNLAYGGPERKQLYFLDADTGSIMVADMDVPGRAMYSHL